MAIPPSRLPPMSIESFQSQQQGPRMDPMADARHRTAGNVLDSRPDPKGGYRDVLDEGWGYRIYGDGKIKVISAPEGHRSGATLDGGPAYDAIIARVNAVAPPPGEQSNEQTRNAGRDMAGPAGGGDVPPPPAPTSVRIDAESEPADEETSGIDALLASIPELGKTSTQERPVTLPHGGTERDVMAMNDMKPGEESEIDFEQLQRGL